MKDAWVGINRLDTVEKKITEFEDSNRNYPNRNTEKKEFKNMNRASVIC